MNVNDARHFYLFSAASAVFTCNGSRRYRERLWLSVDAASLSYDLAVAQAHPSPREIAPRLLGGGA